jgi:hypothetical protein
MVSNKRYLSHMNLIPCDWVSHRPGEREHAERSHEPQCRDKEVDPPPKQPVACPASLRPNPSRDIELEVVVPVH